MNAWHAAFFPNRKSHVLFQSFLGFFLSLDKTVFIISSCTQAADSIWENAWATLFFTTLVLLDPSAQFKHFYVVWSLHFLPKLKQDSVNVRSNLNLIMWFGCSSLSVDSCSPFITSNKLHCNSQIVLPASERTSMKSYILAFCWSGVFSCVS